MALLHNPHRFELSAREKLAATPSRILAATSIRRPTARQQLYCHQAPCKSRSCLPPKQAQHPKHRWHAVRAYRDPSSKDMYSSASRSSSSSMPADSPARPGAATAAAPGPAPLGSYIRAAAQQHAVTQQQQQASPFSASAAGGTTASQQAGSTTSAVGGDTDAATSTSSRRQRSGAAFASIDDLKARDPATGTSRCHLYTGDVPGLPRNHTSRRGLMNQVQLSTYPDAIGDNLQQLSDFVDKHLGGAVGSLHLLPLYPSSGDRGFAPITYQQLDPAFGTYEQLQGMGARRQLLLEFMVNHISPESPQFKDYLAHGEASPWADMFIKWGRFWPQGKPGVQDLLAIRTRKPEPPVLLVTLADGTQVPLWCTFSPQQIDINPWAGPGRTFIDDSLRALCEAAAPAMLRIDAFGYATKRPGTSCFFLEPDVWELMDHLREVVAPYGVQLLAEVHEDYTLNIALARRGYWVYDFALPLLIIHAFHFHTADSLKGWMAICPRRQITCLDTHDGMGVDDIQGLAPVVDLGDLQAAITDALGCNTNMKYYYTHPDYPEPSNTSSKGGDEEAAAASANHNGNGVGKGSSGGGDGGVGGVAGREEAQAATCEACEGAKQAAEKGKSTVGDELRVDATTPHPNGTTATSSNSSSSSEGAAASKAGGAEQAGEGQEKEGCSSCATPRGGDMPQLRDEPDQQQVQQAPISEVKAAAPGSSSSSSVDGAGGAGKDMGCVVGTAASLDDGAAPSWHTVVQPEAAAGTYKSVSHQYNCAYFSSMKENPCHYLLARAIQFFTPGVPMVYYMGMLAGVNDAERVAATGNVRDINRHSYTLDEAEQAVQQPVVQALLALCRFRNQHPAFSGRFHLDVGSPPHVLHVTWKKGRHVADLTADLHTLTATIMHTPYEYSDQNLDARWDVKPAPRAAAAAAAGPAAGGDGTAPMVSAPSIGADGFTPVTSLDWREIVGVAGDGSVTNGGVVSDTAGTDAGEEDGEVELVELRLWPPVAVVSQVA